MARFPDGYVLIMNPTETKLENGNVVINIHVDEKELVMCKHCKLRRNPIKCQIYAEGMSTPDNWYCADGEKED